MSRDNNSAEAKLLDAIRQGDHQGVDAKTVAESLVEKGFARPAAQRIIQSGLDGGLVRLGPKLRLYEGEAA
jgi:hypothetical protein